VRLDRRPSPSQLLARVILAAMHSISLFLAVIGVILLVGWVLERIGIDVKHGRRKRKRRY
jgi:uncharacterized membrane protein YecN with MAPEG domain